jgi:hypothetical protein
VIILCDGDEVVEGPCLHRPENWLVRQLNDKPKPVYKVGFIREKRKVQLRYCSGAWKLVTPCSGKSWGFYGSFNPRLGGVSHWPCISRAFLSELVWLAHLLREGNNLESILSISLVADLYLCISSLGCRNSGLHFLRMQECYCSLRGDGILTHLP